MIEQFGRWAHLIMVDIWLREVFWRFWTLLPEPEDSSGSVDPSGA